MLRVLADNPYHALALDDLALLAHRLHGCSNFHAALSFLKCSFRIIWPLLSCLVGNSSEDANTESAQYPHALSRELK